MKTILVNTDYSDVANNAVQYAVELAKFKGAKLILFHAYLPRVLLSSLTMVNGGFEEENIELLTIKLHEIRKTYGPLPEIELVTRNGFAVEAILDIISEKKVDLVVMGLTGAGKVKEVLMGSTTTSVMQKTKTPVLIIPPDVHFQVPKKIAVALENHAVIPEEVGKIIKEYVEMFNSKLLLFNLVRQVEPAIHGNGHEDTDTAESLSGIEYEVCLRSGEDLVEGLNAFINSRQIDLLMMIPHSHNQFTDIFHKSNTRQMAFHTKIPLISIHE